MERERMLTVKEVAERVRAHEVTVRRWLAEGRMKGYRPGGTKLGWRIPESEVERFLRGEVKE
ncbi:MAG TPA: helix-turn-helix domain-containing protein [Chloroflexota bacterium]|nr:helix-turn-helix domain-containing protein [Chloroflexota bacterium]